MTDVEDMHAQLRAINRSAEFNRWCGLEVTSASAGQVELVMPWRAEFGQYGGFLHAGLIAALIDTACGFAAVTVAGPGVLAAHFSVNCLRPAQGEHFIARARVVRAGKTQVFTACELFAVVAQEEKLVATGEALLSNKSSGLGWLRLDLSDIPALRPAGEVLVVDDDERRRPDALAH